MAGENTYFESDGKSVEVTLTASVDNGQVAYVQGFLGIIVNDGDSGDVRALTIDGRAYQFTVPSTLAVAKGQTVFVDITVLTGHTPGNAAYFTAAGSNRIRLFRAIENKDTTTHVVSGILISGLGLL